MLPIAHGSKSARDDYDTYAELISVVGRNEMVSTFIKERVEQSEKVKRNFLKTNDSPCPQHRDPRDYYQGQAETDTRPMAMPTAMPTKDKR
jgi:hypothetical protein